MTSCRKLVSIWASFLLFPKPFSFLYVIGLVQVLAGLSLEVYVKNPDTVNRLITDWRLPGGWLHAVWPLRMASAMPLVATEEKGVV